MRGAAWRTEWSVISKEESQGGRRVTKFCDTCDLEFDAFPDLQHAVQRVKNRSNMIKFRSRNNRASMSIFGTLKTRRLSFWKINIKRVTVVKFRVNKKSSNNTDSYMIKRMTNTTKITNVLKAASGE
jgi:hypothetical protein